MVRGSFRFHPSLPSSIRRPILLAILLSTVSCGKIGSLKISRPAHDSWTPTTLQGALSPRAGHTAVWSGSNLFIWGGEAAPNTNYLNDGSTYDPIRNVWIPLPGDGAPSSRKYHSAVWTGSQMILWGGQNSVSAGLNDGGVYNSVNQQWSPMSGPLFPFQGRVGHTAVWTGSKMILWGGKAGPTDFRNDGAIYDPNSDTWTSVTLTNAPSGRWGHTTVWTGSKMIVWGGSNDVGSTASGGTYDPVTDSWTVLSTAGAPEARSDHVVAWTGTVMIVWGGLKDSQTPYLNTGGIYDPARSLWAPLSTVNAPPGRTELGDAIWTGSRFLLWGGISTGTPRADGFLYDLSADAWMEINRSGAPTARSEHSTVWTGSQFIVWGGKSASGYLNSGAIYTP